MAVPIEGHLYSDRTYSPSPFDASYLPISQFGNDLPNTPVTLPAIRQCLP